MFDWIRAKVKNAVLGGIADAVEILEKQGASANDDAPQVLEERIRLLPALTVEPEQKGGRRKSAQ